MIELGQLEPEEEGDGQATLVWEGSAQLAELEAQLAQADATRVVLTDGFEELPSVAAAAADQAPPHDPRAWFLGRSFGGFRIVCELASGGMATVFLGRKEGPARVSQHAAIKVVHPHLTHEREFVHMFLDEARIAACLDHPNVCRVLDFGHAEGTYYLAMEYLLGETWSSVRVALSLHPEGQSLLPSIAAHVMAQACEGLSAAHEAADDQGRPLHVVHRDVSPQNIFVAYDGTVRVLDFGVASAADRITSTRDGVLKGRLAYMSPEQMAVAPLSRAADIWSMGVVLREALEGKRLFRRASDAETMFAVTSEPLPEWSVEPPAQLRQIVERALQRDPEARYPTAQALGLELTRFAASRHNAIGTSALSTWMHALFPMQIEQKRALLQLPIPEPSAGAAPPGVQLAAGAHAGDEPLGGTALLQQTQRVPAEQALRRRTRAWLNRSALLALGCLGATTGLVLGRVARDTGADEPVTQAPAARTSAPTPSAAPTLEVIPHSAATPPTDDDEQPTPTTTTPPGLQRAHATTHTKLDERPASGPQQRADTTQRQADSADAPPAGAAQAPGTLLVAFEGGWAEVYLGGKLLGTTPARFELPAGRHTLTIKPFGTGAAFKKRVTVEQGVVSKLFLSTQAE